MYFSFGSPFDVIQSRNVVFISLLSFSRQRTSLSVMSVLLWNCFVPAYFVHSREYFIRSQGSGYCSLSVLIGYSNSHWTVFAILLRSQPRSQGLSQGCKEQRPGNEVGIALDFASLSEYSGHPLVWFTLSIGGLHATSWRPCWWY